VLFTEPFANNSQGWTLGTTWEIGPAKASTGQVLGNPDPATDHSPGNDNGVAGVVIGGNVPNTTHPAYYLESPEIDTSAAGGVKLYFQRWLNSDFTPGAATIDVYDGSKWVTIWPLTTPPPPITDSAWTAQALDLSQYSNSKLKLRFGYAAVFTGPTVSGWNIDDVQVVDSSCN